MKPWIKKILIVAVTTLFLVCTVKYAYNSDYHFSKEFELTEQTQKIFWGRIDDNARFKKAGGINFSKNGGGFHDGYPVFIGFSINLDGQWNARYGYNPWPGDEDIFEVDFSDTENEDKRFIIYVSQKDLKVIKDDKKHRIKGTISPEERKRIDVQTTPDSITDTDYLEKLALKKFVEFQDQYFGINN